jgi:hypothetical protein
VVRLRRAVVLVGLVALVGLVVIRLVTALNIADIPRRSVALVVPEEMRNQVFAKKLKCFYAM